MPRRSPVILWKAFTVAEWEAIANALAFTLAAADPEDLPDYLDAVRSALRKLRAQCPNQ